MPKWAVGRLLPLGNAPSRRPQDDYAHVPAGTAMMVLATSYAPEVQQQVDAENSPHMCLAVLQGPMPTFSPQDGVRVMKVKVETSFVVQAERLRASGIACHGVGKGRGGAGASSSGGGGRGSAGASSSGGGSDVGANTRGKGRGNAMRCDS